MVVLKNIKFVFSTIFYISNFTYQKVIIYDCFLCAEALNLNKKIKLENYAKDMQGLSYALVVKIANDAAKKSIINSHKEISADDLNKALEENLAFNK